MNDVNGYAEDHSPINIRLAWSLLMNLAAGAVLLYSYMKGFNETKWMLAIASPLYLLSAGAYNLWNSRLSVPTFYRGASAQKKTVWLCSEIELPAANYILTPMVGSGGSMSKLPAFKTCIGNWITEDGFVDAGALEADLAKLKFSQLKSE